jgi:Trypsin-like peptidase domain
MYSRKLLLLGVTAAALIAIGPSSASAWAPAASAPIHPGVQTVTSGGQCTSNFVFQDGSSTYLGQAAHCSSTGGQTSTDGCETGSQPIGTPVEIEGASRPGTLVYNSWLTMQARGESDPDTCAFNDLALVRIDPADVANVNPSVPGFGGPIDLGPSSAMLGDTVYSYGNSSLRFGIGPLKPKQGTVVQSEGDGWSRTVLTVTPGIPGDSGSGFMSGSGEAIGVLSTLQIAPLAGTNGVGDLRHEIDYMHANSSFGAANLVNGTEPFRPDLVGAILGS